MLATNLREHQEPELEIVLGVKTLAGSNPASSAGYQHKWCVPQALAAGVSVLARSSPERPVNGWPADHAAMCLRRLVLRLSVLAGWVESQLGA
jgi:hypothetical protein